MIPNNLTGPELKKWLQAHAHEQKTGAFFRRFEQSELDKIRASYADGMSALAEEEDSVKEAIKDLKYGIKQKKANLTAMLRDIRRKGVDATGTTYLVRDYDNKRVITYTEDGTEIENRMMTPEERQLSIDDTPVRQMHTGTND